MTDLLQHLASYGVAGLLIAAIAVLLYRLIERGFEMRVPPPGAIAPEATAQTRTVDCQSLIRFLVGETLPYVSHVSYEFLTDKSASRESERVGINGADGTHRATGLANHGFVQVPSLYRQQRTPPWLEHAPLPVASLSEPSLQTAPTLQRARGCRRTTRTRKCAALQPASCGTRDDQHNEGNDDQ
jgi:hypothetical protein